MADVRLPAFETRGTAGMPAVTAGTYTGQAYSGTVKSAQLGVLAADRYLIPNSGGMMLVIAHTDASSLANTLTIHTPTAADALVDGIAVGDKTYSMAAGVVAHIVGGPFPGAVYNTAGSSGDTGIPDQPYITISFASDDSGLLVMGVSL